MGGKGSTPTHTAERQVSALQGEGGRAVTKAQHKAVGSRVTFDVCVIERHYSIKEARERRCMCVIFSYTISRMHIRRTMQIRIILIGQWDSRLQLLIGQ